MKFKVNNLGNIEGGEVEIGKLTIICGDNHTGKTYLSYAIFGLINYALRESEFQIDSNTFDKLFDKGFLSLDITQYSKYLEESLKRLINDYQKQIHNVFNSDEKYFTNFKISVDLNTAMPNLDREIQSGLGMRDKQIVKIFKAKKSQTLEVTLLESKDTDLPRHIIQTFLKQQIAHLYLGSIFKRPFAISSERTGVSLFYRDLDTNRNQIIEYITKTKKFDPYEMLSKITSSYAAPIQNNIDFVRDYEAVSKKKSFISNNIENKSFIDAWSNFLNGSFKISDNQTVFVHNHPRHGSKSIPLHISSAALKSLFIMDMYIRHFARIDDLLLIDEPELNLHPTNQIMLARLLVRLMNMGINILITTHSDYVLKELNNLLLLSNQFKSKEDLMKKYQYLDDHIINPSDIKVYAINDQGYIEKMPADSNGIILDLFDKTILNINQISDDIYYSINS